MPQRYDAIVVGGGHNGLVAAHYLAAAGLGVLVLERRAVVGGPCGTIEFMPGYRSSVTNSPGSLEPRIVRDMALERHGLAWQRPDPSLIMPFEGGRAFLGWRDRSRVDAQLACFAPGDVAAYYAVFEEFNAFARRLGVSLFAPPPSLRELVSRLETPADELAFAEIMLGSIRDFLDHRLRSEEAKALIATLAVMSNMVGPSTPGTPALLLQRPMSLLAGEVAAEHDPRKQVLRGSTGLPRGGMGSIARAMEASLRARGVAIRTEAAVDRILVEAGEVRGVVLRGGEVVGAPLVLSNLNPQTTLLDLVEERHIPAGTRERLGRVVMRGSSFKLVLALDRLPRFAAAQDEAEALAFAACQFRIAPSMEWMDRGYDRAKLGELPEHPMLWGLTPSVLSPELAPPGRHLMSVNVWHAPHRLRHGSWSEARDRFGRHCIDVLAEHVPGLKDMIVDHRFLSPEDLEREFGLTEANATHGDMVPGRMFGFRPLPELADYRTPVRGLYLCGSSCWPGGTVSGLPGHNGSHQALGDLRAGRAAIAALIERRFARAGDDTLLAALR